MLIHVQNAPSKYYENPPMKIAILSRNAKLYSTISLVAAARKRGHRVRVLDPLRCYMRIEPGKFQMRYKSRALNGVDAVIPRIGNSITFCTKISFC